MKLIKAMGHPGAIGRKPEFEAIAIEQRTGHVAGTFSSFDLGLQDLGPEDDGQSGPEGGCAPCVPGVCR